MSTNVFHIIYNKDSTMLRILKCRKENTSMENKRLAESEYRFMNLIWEHEPMPSMQLVTLCKEQ